jgi:hypothetical protein
MYKTTENDVIILQRVDSLLGNVVETINKTTFAARKQIRNKQVYGAATRNALSNKHVPTETIGLQQ